MATFRATKPKDPSAVTPVTITWSAWLNTGESLDTASWSITTAPDSSLAIVANSQVNTATAASCTLSGGTSGQVYVLTCHVVTDAAPIAREDDRSITITVKDR